MWEQRAIDSTLHILFYISIAFFLLAILDLLKDHITRFFRNIGREETRAPSTPDHGIDLTVHCDRTHQVSTLSVPTSKGTRYCEKCQELYLADDCCECPSEYIKNYVPTCQICGNRAVPFDTRCPNCNTTLEGVWKPVFGKFYIQYQAQKIRNGSDPT